MKAVTIYTKATCPYCVRALELLRSKNVQITEIKIDEYPEKRPEMEALSQRKTVPQIFIGDKHVGGCDDLYALEEAGKLDPLLKSENI
jgi:glutaredoxin 3